GENGEGSFHGNTLRPWAFCCSESGPAAHWSSMLNVISSGDSSGLPGVIPAMVMVALVWPFFGSARLRHLIGGQTVMLGSKKPKVCWKSFCHCAAGIVQETSSPEASRTCRWTSCWRGSRPAKVPPGNVARTNTVDLEGRKLARVTVRGSQISGGSVVDVDGTTVVLVVVVASGVVVVVGTIGDGIVVVVVVGTVEDGV